MRLLDHFIIAAVTVQCHTRLRARVCVNDGHFEHKFRTYDFLLCFVRFIGTGSIKNEYATENSCIEYFGIRLQSCARKIAKISLCL